MLLSMRTTRRQELSPPASERSERRREARLRYLWPLWYSRDGNLDVEQGRMVDLCSGGASFLATGGDCPQPGDDIWVRGSYPIVEEGAFGMASFTTLGRVLRADRAPAMQRRIAVQFSAPLEQCPIEAAGDAVSAVGAAV